MKFSARDFLYVVVIIALLAFCLQQCRDKNAASDLYANSQQKVKVWVDKDGHSNAEIAALKMDQDLFRASQQKLVDSLRKELGTAKVKSVVTVTRTITDTLLVKRDPRGLILASDAFTSIWQPDATHIAYNISDSLSIATYNKHYGFLNLKTSYVTRVLNTNPHVRMRGLQSYEIAPKDRKVGLGIMIGYGAGNQGLSPFVGMGLFYRVW